MQLVVVDAGDPPFLFADLFWTNIQMYLVAFYCLGIFGANGNDEVALFQPVAELQYGCNMEDIFVLEDDRNL